MSRHTTAIRPFRDNVPEARLTSDAGSSRAGYGPAFDHFANRLAEDSPMLIQSIHFTFNPEDADRAVGLFRELRDLSRREPGVVRFDVGRSEDRPTVFALWEEYSDGAALKAHVDSDHYRRLVVNGVRPLAKERIGETVFPLE
jgi:quinol monooxygenase YgiN